MADTEVNIEMRERNANNDGWIIKYPKTKGSQVVAADGTTTFESHLSDYVRQPGYAADSGSANTYVVTLTPAPTSLLDGMGVIVKIANSSTGASTLNVNGLGAKTIANPDGSAIVSGDLATGGIYSFKYNSTTGNFILVGKGGVKLTGTASDDKVLAGYTYYNTDPKTKHTGTRNKMLATELNKNNMMLDLMLAIRPNASQNAITEDNDGNIYLICCSDYSNGSNPDIYKFDSKGIFISCTNVFSIQSHYNPIARFDSLGNLYTLTTYSSKVYLTKFDSNLSVLWQICLTNRYPIGLYCDANNNVICVLSDPTNNYGHIYMYPPSTGTTAPTATYTYSNLYDATVTSGIIACDFDETNDILYCGYYYRIERRRMTTGALIDYVEINGHTSNQMKYIAHDSNGNIYMTSGLQNGSCGFVMYNSSLSYVWGLTPTETHLIMQGPLKNVLYIPLATVTPWIAYISEISAVDGTLTHIISCGYLALVGNYNCFGSSYLKNKHLYLLTGAVAYYDNLLRYTTEETITI